MPSDTSDKSEFNNALGYINTLNYFFHDMISQAVIEGDIKAWLQALNRLYVMLSTHMKKEKKELLWQQYKELEGQVARFLQQRRYQQNRLRKNIEIPVKLYDSLTLYEMELRSIAKEAGLETKLEDDGSKWLK